jgi:hypothetical protein
MKLQSSTLPLSEGGILHQAKSLTKILELRPSKRFGEDICNLLVCRKVLHMYFFPLHHISDVMVFDLHVDLCETHDSLQIFTLNGYSMDNSGIHLIPNKSARSL